MGKRGLYSTLGAAQIGEAVKTRMAILAYCDGQHSVVEIAELLSRPAWELAAYFAELVEHGLIETIEPH
jgi:aminopeptidase-like protein